MAPKFTLLLLAFAFLGGMSNPVPARAGDEDVKKQKEKAAPVEPEPTPAPPPTEAPDMGLGEEPSPAFEAPSEAPPPRRAARPARKPWDPDENLDYSELMGKVEADEAGRGVLPPALGFRGYMPSMVAVTAGDRTPGVGAIAEYSRNRIGFGAYYAYRNLHDRDTLSFTQSFVGAYGIYRWLPFDISPLFLLGLEVSSKTIDQFGGIAGIGLDARIYSGLTALLGYTYHSTVHRGFIGGGVGWSF